MSDIDIMACQSVLLRKGTFNSLHEQTKVLKMEMNHMKTNGSKQESNPTVLTACPDKEESGESKIYGQSSGHLAASAAVNAINYHHFSFLARRTSIKFYMNKSTNGKPKIKITDWNAYFGVSHAKNDDHLGEISP